MLQTKRSLPLLLCLSGSLLWASPGCKTHGGKSPGPAASAKPADSSQPAPDPVLAGGGKGLRGGDDGLPKGRKRVPRAAKKKRIGLKGAWGALKGSEYATAKRLFNASLKVAKEKQSAQAGMSWLAYEQGRLSDTIDWAKKAEKGRDKALQARAAEAHARALHDQGKISDAQSVVAKFRKGDGYRMANLAGELFLAVGKETEANAPLMEAINGFNNREFKVTDGEKMAAVARASWLLRSKKDANSAYDDAERAGYQTPELFLRRATLFLSAYNLGRAEEMVRAALKRAPDWPKAHVAMAEIKLAQTLDFDGAEAELRKALKGNPHLPHAYAIRAGILLRDMELAKATKAINKGLSLKPDDPELLSMRAAVRFLSDDEAGLKRLQKKVLGINPRYANFFQIVANYADWEHRYAQIAKLMKEAIAIDSSVGLYSIILGLNQTRIGHEKEGLKNLDAGFAKDGLNVRAFNTLNLYERDIPLHYRDVKTKKFLLRYPKVEKPVLERYLPKFVNTAWASMVRRYRFTPRTPVSIELYGKRQHFAVRTSGLPNIGIQGVCFGETLAAMSPGSEPFNWGMVVWHELGHVFAIQLSKNHVPRWFTEGLSEYETLARRPEWKREQDVDLYLAIKRGTLPKIAEMNRAFTHAEDSSDVVVAYYAASQISVFLVEKYGMPKLVRMLKLWGQGKRTPAVIKGALGVTSNELDKQFRDWARKRLARYDAQFVPDLRAPRLPKAKALVKRKPKSGNAWAKLALARLAIGNNKGALKALAKGREVEKSAPMVRFLSAKLALRQRKGAEAESQLNAMVKEGHDGYFVQMLLADLSDAKRKPKDADAHFQAAHKLDPSQAEPLQALIDRAHKAKDAATEFRYLKKLSLLDEHDRRVWRRLLAMYVAKKDWKNALKTGKSALYTDIHGAKTHTLYAQAFFGAGKLRQAIFEAESATMCEGITDLTASRANVVLAKAYRKLGNKAKEQAARDEALRQDPENPEALALPKP